MSGRVDGDRGPKGESNEDAKSSPVFGGLTRMMCMFGCRRVVHVEDIPSR